jgi:hypothetical protein
MKYFKKHILFCFIMLCILTAPSECFTLPCRGMSNISDSFAFTSLLVNRLDHNRSIHSHYSCLEYIFETYVFTKKNTKEYCFFINTKFEKYFKTVHQLQRLSTFNDNFNDDDRKATNIPDKYSFKPFLKMIIFQNSLNLISHISEIAGQNKKLSKQTISNLCIKSIGFSTSLHKTFLSFDSFLIPFENQKQIIQSSIIKC